MTGWAAQHGWRGQTYWNGGTPSVAPVLLWGADLRTLPAENLNGITSLAGLPLTAAVVVGAPTEWAIVPGVGARIAGSNARGRFTVTYADITAIMSRALTDRDSLIFEYQVSVDTADGSLSANDSGVYLSILSSTGTNFVVTAMTRISGARERQVGRYTGGSTVEAGSLRENAAGRSFSTRIAPFGQSAWGITADTELSFAAPRTAGTSRVMCGSSTGTGTTVGPWSNQGAGSAIYDQVVATGETATPTIEAMALWLIPGDVYVTP